MDKKTNLTKVTVWSGSRYEIPSYLSGAIEWLQKHLEEIPKEFRDTATFEIDQIFDYDNDRTVVLNIDYFRPETGVEKAARVKKELKLKEDRDDYEKKLYKKLKKKFE